ncbi:MAG: TIGR01906 family membrane protein [Anaerolineae bacterium]|nr:TIGR01906 family membrane protein [Anaerolineae bacterium]
MRAFLRALIVLSTLIILVLGAVRATTLPWFPRWAYARAGFPPESYGMAPAERLNLAQACITFLNLPHDRTLLSSLRLSDGSVAFNERELQHMDDVKVVYDRLTTGALLAAVMALCAAWALRRRGERAAIWGALSDGGLLTLVLLVLLGGLMALAWETFFVGLHGIFFKPDTWRFYYTDTLIRLFPEMFWQLAGTIVVVIVVVTAFVLALFGRIIQRRMLRAAQSALPATA